MSNVCDGASQTISIILRPSKKRIFRMNRHILRNLTIGMYMSNVCDGASQTISILLRPS